MSRVVALLFASAAIAATVACSGECDGVPKLPPSSIDAGTYTTQAVPGADEVVVSEDGKSVEHTFTTDAGTWHVRYRVVDAGFVIR